jgi:methyl-accepting chemotaxis protein
MLNDCPNNFKQRRIFVLTFLRNIKIGKKLILLSGFFAVGFIIFGSISYYALNELRVNGPLYKEIALGKDLLADILPPPSYIIESYLVVLQMLEETDKSKLDELLKKGKQLRKDYEARHDFWVKELEESQLKEDFVKKSYVYAMEFFQIRDNEFIPALISGDRQKAQKIASSVLKEKYELHRSYIDKVANRAIKRNEILEKRGEDQIKSITLFLVSLAVGIFVFVLLLSIFFIRHISYSLDSVMKVANEVAQSNLKVSTLSITSSDELGQLAMVFNKMVENLKSLLQQINKEANLVENAANSLASISSQSTEFSKQLVQAIDQISQATTDVAKNSQLATESSTKMLELSKQGRNMLNNVLNKTEDIKNAISLSVRNMRSLVDSSMDRSKDISSIVNGISDIANQTKVLSLNATIAAAKAGEAGSGFSVVASEIRKLAESSQEEVQKIANIIQNILSETETTLKDIEQGQKAVEEVALLIENTHKVFIEIMQQVEQVANQIQEISTATEETSTSTEEVLKQAKKQTSSMEEIATQANQLKQVSLSLKTNINKFKV